MADLLAHAACRSFAASFCVWSMETAKVVLNVARRLKVPVIVMSGPSQFAGRRPDT